MIIGILRKATDAKTFTERASVVEQAKTDVLGYQTENKGTDLQKSQLQTVLETYFKSVPALTDMSDTEILNTELETLAKYGIHNITVKEIFDGTFAQSQTAKWVYNHSNQTVTKGDLTFNIGDCIKYDAPESTGYTGIKKWRVLGVGTENDEDGKLLLVSEGIVYSADNKGQSFPMLQLSGENGIDAAINQLNEIGALYKNSNMATKGRSINVKDVNTITGYNPEANPFTDGMTLYGNTTTYTIKNGKLNYRCDKKEPYEDTETSETYFKLPGESENIINATPVKSTAYSYDANALAGFDSSSDAFSAIFGGSHGTFPYFLASPYTYSYATSGINTYYGVFMAGWGGTVKGSPDNYLWHACSSSRC